MTGSHVQRLRERVRATKPAVLMRAADLCDGHTIFTPQAFLDAGLPGDVVEHLTRTHASDGSPKGTVFVSGRAVTELRGVYGLDVLRFLAAALEVEYPDCLGRGTEARMIQAAIKSHLGRPAGPNAG